MHDMLLSAASTVSAGGWIAKLDIANAGDEGNGLVIDSNENIYITGIFNGNYLLVVKHDSTGTYQWQKGLSVGSVGYSIARDSDNNIYVAGSYTTTSAILLKYDSAGTIVWQRAIDVLLTADIGYTVAVDSSNNVYFAGATNTAGFIVKYNPAGTGSVLWQASLGTSSRVYGITTDSSNNVFATVYNNAVISLVKLDSDGNLLWQRQLDTSGVSETGYSVITDSSSNCYVTGTANGLSATSSYMFIVKYDSAGGIQWQKKLDTTSVQDTAKSIAIDSFENLYIVGNTGTYASSYMFLYKYDPSGNCLWQRKLSTDVDQIANGIAIGPSGKVYIVTRQNTSTTAYILIIKLASDGYGLGSYKVDGSVTLTYSDLSLTDSVATLTESAGSLAYARLDNDLKRLKLAGTAFAVLDMAMDSSENMYFAAHNNISSSDIASWLYGVKSTNIGDIYTPYAHSYPASYKIGSVAKDSNSSVYIAISAAVDIYSLVYTILAKYDVTTKALLWMNKAQKTTGNVLPYAMTTDSSGNLYLAGEVVGNAYLAKFSPNGAILFQSALMAGTLRAVALDSSNNIFTVGYTATFAFLVKYDSAGTVVWQKKLDITSAVDRGLALALDSSGNIYLAGQSYVAATTASIAILAKFDATGTNLWKVSLNDGASLEDKFNALAINANGDIFAGGVSGTVALLVKYNSSGTVIWQRKISGTEIISLKVTNTGYLYISDSSGYIYKLKDTGEATLNMAEYVSTTLVAAVPSPTFADAGLSVSSPNWGRFSSGSETDFIIDSSDNLFLKSNLANKARLSKFDTNRNLVFSTTLAYGATNVIPGPIKVDATGNSYITEPLGVSKFNPSGVHQWSKSINSASYPMNISDVDTDTTGNVYYIGNNVGGANKPTYSLLVKLTAAGAVVWVRKITLITTVFRSRVVIDSDNNIYCALTSGSNIYVANIVLIKFDSSGNTLWQRNLDIANYQETLFELKIDNTGRVFLLWNSLSVFNSDGTAAMYMTSFPAIFNSVIFDSSNNIYMSSNTGEIYKFNSSGVQQWKRKFGTSLIYVRKVVGNALYCWAASPIKIPADGTIIPADVTYITADKADIAGVVGSGWTFTTSGTTIADGFALLQIGDSSFTITSEVPTYTFTSFVGLTPVAFTGATLGFGVTVTPSILNQSFPEAAVSLAAGTPALTYATVTI
jgi:hypothetical protein